MNKKLLFIPFFFFILLLIIIGIAYTSKSYFPSIFSTGGNQEAPKLDSTGYTQEEVKKLADSNNKFAFDLYPQLAEIKGDEGNIFYSPYSIFSALLMTYEGARGNTAKEMKEVFYLPDTKILRPNFAEMFNSINKKSDEYELMTGNAIWVQKDYALLPDYLDVISKHYGGRISNLDFINDTENSRIIINTYIEKQTKDKIKNLIEKGNIEARTRVVLTNAVYFKGKWLYEFDKSKTRDMDFNITSSNIIKVPTMEMQTSNEFKYIENDELQMIELPYKGNKISMYVILPKDTRNFMQKYLTKENLDKYFSEMTETKLETIRLPKFKYEDDYSLKAPLSELGMMSAFDPDMADFSGMTGNKTLYIGKVIHKSFIEVDEVGTEAVAATAVVIGKNVSIDRPKNFVANRPFIFLIREKKTGNILFMGRIVDPRK